MTVEAERTPRVLSIAGSDSGGGAGIQADLKAFARCGVHGMTALTAITAQNTVAVQAVQELPGELILAQVRAVLSDIGVDAVKVGMLAGVEIVLAVAQALDELPSGTPVVVDPVMVSESGSTLLADDARGALIEEILPRATVITPNLPEARVLVGLGSEREHSPEKHSPEEHSPEEHSPEKHSPEKYSPKEHPPVQLMRSLLELGPRAVVLTGGHREEAEDLFFEASLPDPVAIPGARHPAGTAHGSGCTHSSILAAQLALGHSPLEAASIARLLAGQAVADGLRDVGEGCGPVDVVGLAWIRASAASPARGFARGQPSRPQEAFAHLP